MAEAYITRRGGGSAASSGFPEFTYTGTYQLMDDGINKRTQNWRIKFLTSGVLTFTKLDSAIDVFLVGGGGGGGHWSDDTSGGGGSGFTTTRRGIVPDLQTNYTITIGAGAVRGGDGGISQAFQLQVYGGAHSYVWSGRGYFGGDGGSGGGAKHAAGGTDGSDGTVDPTQYSGYQAGKGQGTTTREFGEPTGDLYAYGGCGQDCGGTFPSKYASQNTGNGGGGTITGSSGIVIIRNRREAV